MLATAIQQSAWWLRQQLADMVSLSGNVTKFVTVQGSQYELMLVAMEVSFLFATEDTPSAALTRPFHSFGAYS